MKMSPEMTALVICIQSRTPAFLWGEPGIGKTKTTEALVEAVAERCWPVILSIREPQDQGGLPVLMHEEGAVWMAPPKWAKELAEEGKGTVFLDELNVSAPNVQNSALRVVNEGWAGDQKLPQSTSFVGAGNPPETNTGAYDLTAAMANRFVHIRWPIDHEGWCAGTIAGWPKPVVPKLPTDWIQHISEMTGLVVAFIRVRPQMLHQKPDDPTEAGRAWPSPRTWTVAARLLAAAKSLGYSIRTREARVLVEGCVGQGAATEFLKWLVNLDLRPAEEYLSDPSGTPLPPRQDQLMAVLDAVASAALDRSYKVKERTQRYKKAWTLLGRVAADKPDICIPAGRVLANNLPAELDNDLPEELDLIAPLLEKANIDFSAAS